MILDIRQEKKTGGINAKKNRDYFMAYMQLLHLMSPNFQNLLTILHIRHILTMSGTP